MWGLGNSWADARNTPMTSYNTMMHEINVLLVDHDHGALINTAKLLEICQYRVTFVELASAAIAVLSNGKVNFDIVMANINSPDLHGFQLVQMAASMNILVILMSTDDNSLTAMNVLERGAFMYIKKPASLDVLRYMWQHVVREKTRSMRGTNVLMATNYGSRGVEFREPNHKVKDKNPNHNMEMMMDKGKGKMKIKGLKGVNKDSEYGLKKNLMFNDKVKRKACTEWTLALHEKFMDAVEQLGEGRCFPKEILALMNVPGLTRMQVASHLQKCRNDKWRSPEDRKSQPKAIQTPIAGGPQQRPRKFGSMPKIGMTSSQEACGSIKDSETVSDAEAQNGASSGPVDVVDSRPNYDFRSLHACPSNAERGIQFHPIFNPNQNSSAKSMEIRSQWSSETSNFESDESDGGRGRGRGRGYDRDRE